MTLVSSPTHKFGSLPMIELGGLVEFRRGLTYKKSDEVEFSSTGVLRASNVDLANGQLDLTDIRYLSDDVDVPRARKLVADSLLICTASGSRAHLGKMAHVSTALDFAFGGFMGLLVPKADVSARYLWYFSRSDAYRDYLEALAPGANINNLRFDDLARLEIPLPPLDEQKRIVAVLDQAFAALDRARANAEANLAEVRTLQAYAADDLLSDPKLGDWDVCGNHIDLLSGFAFKSAGYSDKDADIRLVRGDNIVQGTFRWSGVKRWPVEDRATFEKYELAKGDVLVAMDRTWVSAGIKYAVVDDEALPSLLVQRVARLRPKVSILPDFLAHWIGSPQFERYVLSIQTGLGVPHVSGDQIRDFPIRVPSLELQSKLVEKLTRIARDCSDLSAGYQRQIEDIAALRQSLLQAAFSGQLT